MDPLEPRRRGFRGREYPGKPQAIWSIIVGFIVLVVMTPIFASADAPPGFMLLPLLMGLGSIGYGLYYLFAEKPAGERVFELDLPTSESGSPEDRLRRLEEMRRDKLITEEEYQSKRGEILKQL